MTAMNDRELREEYPAVSAANKILNIAKSLDGFKQSKSWQQYADAFDKAVEITRAPEPNLPGLDVPATKVEAIIRGHADELAKHRALVDAAHAAAEYAAGSINIEANRAVHGVISLLGNVFNEAVDNFRASQGAPDKLTGYETTEQVATFQARIRAAGAMSYLWGFRIELGRVLDEDGITNDGGIWCMLGAPEPGTLDEILADWVDVVAAAYELGNVSPVEQWALFTDRGMPLSIAPLGTLQDRREEWRMVRGRITGRPQLTTLGDDARREQLGLPPRAA